MKLKYFIILFFCISVWNITEAQNTQILNKMKSEIQKESQFLSKRYPLEKRMESSKKIKSLILKACQQEKSIQYSFDSLKFVSVVSSKNKQLRIFTWFIPLDNNTFEYHGVVQAYNKRRKRYLTTSLEDKGRIISRPQTKTLSAEKWYGAYYYKLITNKYKGRTTYTLLGWKGIDFTKTAHIVDIITLKSNGSLQFGYAFFDMKKHEKYERNKRPKRLVFTHSAKANMHLSYDLQTILKLSKQSRLKKTPITKDFRAQKKAVRTKQKYKKVTKNMIVMDRLVVLNPSMEDFPQFYIPAINVVDALLYEKGKWRYYGDIDARNKVDIQPKKSNIEYDLVPEEEE